MDNLANLTRRNMTPEEMTVADLASGRFRTEPVLGGTALPPAQGVIGKLIDLLGAALPAEDNGVLMALPAWRRKGLNAEDLRRVMQYLKRPVDDVIAAKDTVFHATDPDFVDRIFRSGEIVPGAGAPPAERGVSVSRVPRVASKADKSVSFVIPRGKMPPTRPFTEPAYEKTIDDFAIPPQASAMIEQIKQASRAGDWATVDRLSAEYAAMLPPPAPNRHFEFEDRTYNESIPLSAATEFWIDRSALPRAKQRKVDFLRGMAERSGLTVREFETGREMHSGRARIQR